MQKITVKSTVEKEIETVWELWTKPEHVMNWNHANKDWHTPNAENNLKVGGEFVYHMAAKDGSMAFDFAGTYTKVEPQAFIKFTLGDGREVAISFEQINGATSITETFDPDENSRELQEQGWQAILNNFKAYAERRSLITLINHWIFTTL